MMNELTTKIMVRILRLNFNVFCEEYIFGIISPNSNRRNVRIIVITINSTIIDSPKSIQLAKK